MRRKRSQTIEFEDELETDSATTPKEDGQARQTMFASFRGEFQSAIGSLNGRDSLNVTEGTRIALRQDAEGRWVWAFVPPAPHDEGVWDEGTWPRLVNVMGYENMLYSNAGSTLMNDYRDSRTISHDEWDQYKCGSQNFQCYVPLPPGIPIVKLRDKSRATPLTPPSPSPVPELAPRSSRKRRLSDSGIATTKESKRARTDGLPSKRPTVVIDLADDVSYISTSPSESDTEVEEIIHIRPQRPPQRNKPNSKGKGRDYPSSRPPLPFLEELFSIGIPLPSTPTGFMRGTSKPPEMKTSMDTDPAAPVKRRRTSNTNEECIAIIDTSFAESSEHDRSNAKRARRLSPDGLQREANQKLRERKLREEQRRQHHGNSSSTPLPIMNRTKHPQSNERDFWSTVDFSSLKGQQFNIEESPAPPVAPRTVPEVNKDEEDGDYETDEDEDEDDFFHSPESEAQPEDELDPVRLAAIEESKRKLAELEKDRPIWEAAELKRELAEMQRRLRAEKERADRLARKELERLEKIRREELAEQARRAWKQAEEEARRRKYAEDTAQAQKKAQEARRKLAEESEKLREQHRRHGWRYFEEFLGPGGWQYGTGAGSTRFPGWGGAGGPSSYPRSAGAGASPGKSANLNGWTPRKALDQYNQLAAEFDSLRVSESAPLDMSKVPWPVLHAPGYKLAQVDWSAVEAFFSQAEILLGGKKSPAWKELLKSSARRFHPDRWRARGLIGPYGGGQEVEDRVNDVAKALNPLYKEVS
jgi:hypothetical protein